MQLKNANCAKYNKNKTTQIQLPLRQLARKRDRLLLQ